MRAQAFCIAAHCAVGQKRKYTGEDYYLHPIEVAELIQEHATSFTKEMIVAAHLHDVVEDTQVELSIIAQQFGTVVAAYVEQLTDVSRPEDGNRAARKAIDLAHTARASPQAKTIKLADLVSNTRSIVERDPAFAVTYLAEKRLLLEVLKEGDQNLYRIAHELAHSQPLNPA
jgi:(p)ppGpp synthase/HD superfamily hydrolase